MYIVLVFVLCYLRSRYSRWRGWRDELCCQCREASYSARHLRLRVGVRESWGEMWTSLWM